MTERELELEAQVKQLTKELAEAKRKLWKYTDGPALPFDEEEVEDLDGDDGEVIDE